MISKEMVSRPGVACFILSPHVKGLIGMLYHGDDVLLLKSLADVDTRSRIGHPFTCLHALGRSVGRSATLTAKPRLVASLL